MSIVRSRPAMRWLVPAAAAVTVIGGGAAVGILAANAGPSLPERSAAQLLVDLQTAKLDGMSGTVVQRADLGLPPIIGKVGGELGALVAGTNTVRVWYAGPQRQRIAVLSTLGQTDVIHDGRDLWVWNSQRKEAVHHTLPEGAGHGDAPKEALPTALPSTPQQAADQALAAIEPSTEVTVGRAARIAGRDAYELVLTPKDEASLVGQVRIAIDAAEHVPLRFEVFADGNDRPAFEVAFTQVDFAQPDPAQFAFNPPRGTKVTEAADLPDADGGHGPDGDAKPGERPAGMDEPTTVGTGWTTVWVAKRPTDEAVRGDGPAGDAPAGEDAPAVQEQVDGLVNGLPTVSGQWGSGRLLTTTLVNVLLTDDGRVIAGAVTPERLYEVAAKR